MFFEQKESVFDYTNIVYKVRKAYNMQCWLKNGPNGAAALGSLKKFANLAPLYSINMTA